MTFIAFSQTAINGRTEQIQRIVEDDASGLQFFKIPGEAREKLLFRGRGCAVFWLLSFISYLPVISGRTLGLQGKQMSLGYQQICQTEQREELRSVLDQTTVTDLPPDEQILDDVERMLNLRPDARLRLLDPFVEPSQIGIRRGLALARPRGDVSLCLGLLLLDALIPGSPKASFLAPCGRACAWAMSLTFAWVVATLCVSPEVALTPMCAFMPKCHLWPFFV